jgi:ABC-type amino acid transport substrate-binding protein
MMKRMMALALALLVLSGCSAEKPSTNKSPLVVGMECAYPPFNWIQNERTDFAVAVEGGMYCDGYDVQIAKAIADGLNRDLKIHVNPVFDALITDVQNNKIDLIIAGMTDTPDRRTAVDFTDIYYNTSLVLMVRKDSKYANATSIQDFSEARVAAQTGTIHDELIKQINNVDHQLTVKNFPLLATQLNNKALDAFVSENVVAEAIAASNPDLTYITFAEGKGFEIDEDMSVSVGLAKGSPLKTDINKVLAGLSEEQRTEMMNAAISRQP